MLHEVLLALSGHPSPLVDNRPSQTLSNNAQQEDFPLLSPSEKALLRSIGQLSELHRKLRYHIQSIASNHKSIICRAVATSIRHTHLARFQENILDVESKILTKDSSMVGAYDIVPLAGVVGEFDAWHRRMAWHWDVACFMRPHGSSSPAQGLVRDNTGAAVINKLRAEQQTGFPDIAQTATELSKVAETAWLRQIASWVLYGKLPPFGTEDFFINAVTTGETEEIYFSKDKDFLPKFVTPPTATSILFIGKSLHQVRKYGRQARQSKGLQKQPMSESELACEHLQQFTTLALPIVPAQLSRAVSTIRLSLSQNVLQQLLPVEMTLQLLSCLKQFFLLIRGEFAIALISEAENRLQSRQRSMGRLLRHDPMKALQGLAIKDAEMHQTLSQTFKALAARDEEVEDDILEFARSHLSLAAPTKSDSRPSSSDSVQGVSLNLTPVTFNDLLFPSAAALGLSIRPPLDLFISQKEIDIYSTINAYLLAIERSRLRLSELWKHTPARRDHPTPVTATTEGRARVLKRRVATRKIWATCSAANLLLSETVAYFEGEVVQGSWARFENWVGEPAINEHSEDSALGESTSSAGKTSQRDPETLASGHRTFLSCLAYALLLNDVPYTRELRSLLGNVDVFIAFFDRLLDIQQKLDLENETDGETGHTIGEERRLSLELDRARKKVDSDLKSVVGRLRQLDHERIGSARYFDSVPSECGFEAWKGGGVDRLLMKLEFGRVMELGVDIV